MRKSNDGGPAFPLIDAGESDRCPKLIDRGMSLRAYFAGNALAGMIAAQWEGLESFPSDTELQFAAGSAVKFADALLAELEK